MMENNLRKIVKKNILEEISIGILLLWMIIFSSSLVSSAEGCCSLDSSNATCSYVDSADCPSSSSFQDYVLCEDASFCQAGCCYNNSLGIYDVNSLESSCNLNWIQDPTCNSLPGSDLGCCIYGGSVDYINQGACVQNSANLGVDTNWDSSLSFLDCQEIPSLQDKGACVLEGGFCSISTQEICSSIGGDFSSRYLCTSQSLNTVCVPSEQTECVSGLDQVYFIDSCGNQANVYDDSKVGVQSYWETIISPEQSCNFDESNVNSTECGNCDFFKSSICSSTIEDSFNVNYGTNYCKNLGCQFEGEPYNNGDSWCRYDGAIGNGDDVVGSRHWKYSCNQGTVEVDPCSDYRQEICVQKNTEENGEIVARNGECLVNPWKNCLDLNNNFKGNELVEECESSLSCRIEEVFLGNPLDTFRFKKCVAQYPPGFNLKDEDSIEEAVNVCKLSTQRCSIPRKRKWTGGCKIKNNGNCRGAVFTEEMNDFCRSLGDCGGSVNYDGTFEKNYVIRGAPDLAPFWINRLINLSNPIEGQYAILENYSVYFEIFGINEGVIRNGNMNSPTTVGLLEKVFTGREGEISFLESFFIGQLFFKNFWRTLWGSCSSIQVDYTCNVWQPPVGGEYCENCNGDSLKPCSKYRCETLGASCEILNENAESPEDIICIDGGAEDANPPVLTPWYEIVSSAETYSDVTLNGYSVTSLSGGCLDAYVPITFGVTSDEPAICKYDFEELAFSDMLGEMSNNVYLYNHGISINLIDPEHVQFLGGSWVGDVEISILCQDSNGYETPNFYNVSMCVNQAPDLSAPIIHSAYPNGNSFIGYETAETEVFVYTNELAQCRWDLSDGDYSSMGNDFSCIDSLGFQSSPFGYVCSDNLPTENDINQFYIRCADQPWFIDTVNEGEMNINLDSYSYVLKKPTEKIFIEWINPEISFEISTETISIDLNVKTSGGGEGHRCYYSITEDGIKIPMFLPDENNVHSQPSLNLFPQLWTFYITCVDELGDSVEDQTSFEIIYDDSFPQISRVWNDFGEIFLITDEPSECRYSTSSCNFEWEDATTIGNEITHVIDSVPGKEYFIKCEDEFENTPAECSVSVIAL